MTQTATVQRIVGTETAEIAVLRASACGHDCADCGGCKTRSRTQVIALAENGMGAQVGDRVQVECGTARVLGIAAAVYLLPFVLFFLFYFLGASLEWVEGGSLALGAVGFLGGAVVDILLNRMWRRRSSPAFRITAVWRD